MTDLTLGNNQMDRLKQEVDQSVKMFDIDFSLMSGRSKLFPPGKLNTEYIHTCQRGHTVRFQCPSHQLQICYDPKEVDSLSLSVSDITVLLEFASKISLLDKHMETVAIQR